MSRRFHNAVKERQSTQSQADRLKEQLGQQGALSDALSLPLIGSVSMWAGAQAPDDDRFLLCDASVYPASEYPDLYAVIGETWNNGSEDAGTFRVPDTPGRTIVGAGAGSGLTNRQPAQKFGNEAVGLSVEQLPAHNHTGATGNSGNHSHEWSVTSASNAPTSGSTQIVKDTASPGNGSGGGGTNNRNTSTEPSHSHSIPSVGSGEQHSSMQPSVAMHMIIRAKL